MKTARNNVRNNLMSLEVVVLNHEFAKFLKFLSFLFFNLTTGSEHGHTYVAIIHGEILWAKPWYFSLGIILRHDACTKSWSLHFWNVRCEQTCSVSKPFSGVQNPGGGGRGGGYSLGIVRWNFRIPVFRTISTFRLPDPNGRTLYPCSDQIGSKTIITPRGVRRGAHTNIAYRRKYPPPSLILMFIKASSLKICREKTNHL